MASFLFKRTALGGNGNRPSCLLGSNLPPTSKVELALFEDCWEKVRDVLLPFHEEDEEESAVDFPCMPACGEQFPSWVCAKA